MAAIQLIRGDDKPWEEVTPEWAAKYKAGDAGLRFKRLLGNATGALNMQRTQYHPGHHEPPHKHPEDEILYLLAGSIMFGRDALKAGDAIFVPRDTVYSLRCGDEGAEFLRVGFGDPSPA